MASVNLSVGTGDGVVEHDAAALTSLSPLAKSEIDRIVVSLERHPSLGFGFLLQPWAVRDLDTSLRSVDGVENFRALLRFSPGGVPVQRVIEDTPASRAKICKWDVLVAVDGKDVTALPVSDVNDMIRGKQTVKLDFLRDKKIDERYSAAELRLESQSLLEKLATAIGFGEQEGGWGDLSRHVGPATETGVSTFDIVVPKSSNYGLNPANWNVQALEGRLKACENCEEYKYLLAFAEGTGVPIINVADHSAAYSAGVRKFDVVRKINGVEVTDVSQFCELVRSSTTDLRLTVIRDVFFFSKHSVLMAPSALKISTERKWKCLLARIDAGGDSAVSMHDLTLQRSRFGFGFVPMSWTLSELDTTLGACAHREDFSELLEFAFDGGLPVGEIIDGSPAALSGLKKWDVIQYVNGEDVRSWTAAVIREWVKKAGDVLTLRVIRNVYSARADSELRATFAVKGEVGFVDRVLGAGWLYDPMKDQKRAEDIKATLVEAFRSGENIKSIDIRVPFSGGKAFGFVLQPVNIADLKSGAGWSNESMYEQLLSFAKDGGVPVMKVEAGSEAEKAGLLRWDVVQFVNGVDVRQFKVGEVQRMIKMHDNDLSLRVLRDPSAETRHAALQKEENPGLLALVGKGWLWGRRN